MRLAVRLAFEHEGRSYLPGEWLEMSVDSIPGLIGSTCANGAWVRLRVDLPDLSLCAGDIAIVGVAEAVSLLDRRPLLAKGFDGILTLLPPIAEPLVFSGSSFVASGISDGESLVDAYKGAIERNGAICCPWLLSGRISSGEMKPMQFLRQLREIADWDALLSDSVYQEQHLAVKRVPDSLVLAGFLGAAHSFVAGLQDGSLLAEGVAEVDLYDDVRRQIPTGFWARDIVLDLERNELREAVHGNEAGERRFSHVIVRAAKSIAKNAPDIAAVPKTVQGERPSRGQEESRQTGRVGRPSKAEEIKAIYNKMVEEGCMVFGSGKMTAAIKEIRNRVMVDYDTDEKGLGDDAIGNVIRDAFRLSAKISDKL